MKRIIGILLFAVCANAWASVDYYNGKTVSFPDEGSAHGLPEVIPCVTKKAFNGQDMLSCVWLSNTRSVSMWNPQSRQNVNIPNQMPGVCTRGVCRVQGIQVGQWKQDTPFLLSIWYHIGSSTDGKPVAYRQGSSRQVSYSEAGDLLIQFYTDAGIPDSELASTFDKRYEGGYAAWKRQWMQPTAMKVSAQQSYPDVKTAWCNPRMDDDCYVDSKKVPIANLGKYLPSVSESNVDQLGGYCEAILCFDRDNVPLGYLLQN